MGLQSLDGKAKEGLLVFSCLPLPTQLQFRSRDCPFKGGWNVGA